MRKIKPEEVPKPPPARDETQVAPVQSPSTPKLRSLEETELSLTLSAESIPKLRDALASEGDASTPATSETASPPEQEQAKDTAQATTEVPDIKAEPEPAPSAPNHSHHVVEEPKVEEKVQKAEVDEPRSPKQAQNVDHDAVPAKTPRSVPKKPMHGLFEFRLESVDVEPVPPPQPPPPPPPQQVQQHHSAIVDEKPYSAKERQAKQMFDAFALSRLPRRKPSRLPPTEKVA